jgi:DNA-nicking Smr family endonuclease
MSADDRDLFRRSVGGARPLKQDTVPPYRRRRRPVPEQTRRDEAAVIDSLLDQPAHEMDVETGEELLFVRPGLQKATIRKLRRGHFVVQAELDLHGHTVAEARTRMTAFLQRARDYHWQCVRIVHGKGNRSAGKLPVLKGKVNGWLQQRDEVLAFCSAPPLDGGTGAVYVLLKRR